jgi:acyl CoA:acetate/3-ketoacid CoA transferase alpha subunit
MIPTIPTATTIEDLVQEEMATSTVKEKEIVLVPLTI